MRFDYKRENPRAATLGFSIPKNGGNKSVGSLPTIVYKRETSKQKPMEVSLDVSFSEQFNYLIFCVAP